MSKKPAHLAGLTGRAAEVLSAVPCEVVGKVPAWLEGDLFRNGPGCFDVTTRSGVTASVPHWFDGLTLLHRFKLTGGVVSYSNRYLYPKLEQYFKKHGRLAGSFGGDPCQTLFGAVLARLSSPLRWLAGERSPLEFNVGVTIGKIQGNRLVSKTDFNGLVEVDPSSLEASPFFRYTDINPDFAGFMSAAHGQYDPHTREYYNFTLDFPRGQPTYTLFCIPDDDPSGYVLARLQADAAYIHSFAMTEHYLVFIVWPAMLSVLRLALGGSPGPALRWTPEKGAVLYIVDRAKGGKGHVATYRAPAFFCFHTINSFELEDGSVHVDLCGYDDITLIKDLYMKQLRSGVPGGAQGTIRRYTMPDITAAAAAGRDKVQAAEVQVLCDGRGKGAELMELPRINSAFTMRPYTYVYCVAKAASDSLFFDALAKVDVRTGELMTWQKEGHFPGEPIFIPSPGTSEEDDGILLSVVLEGAQTPGSFLLVLDAKTMQEVARAQTPHPVPFGFHGNFFASPGAGGSSTQLD